MPGRPALAAIDISRRLESASFSREQAEVQTEALAGMVTEAIATKQDLRELEYRLTLRLGAMMTVSVSIVAALAKLL